MKRKETYLFRDFRETAAQRFPAQAKQLNAAFDMRLNALLSENAGASKEKQYHLKRQILPGIAAYETLQRVMPKEEALQIVHGYVEELARTSHKQLAALLHIPGLYRLVPGVFVKSTRNVFGPAAGFDSKELQVGNGTWRVDKLSYICNPFTVWLIRFEVSFQQIRGHFSDLTFVRIVPPPFTDVAD